MTKIKKIPVETNEHYPETQPIVMLEPFPGQSSSPRKQMFANQVGQAVVISGLTEPMIQTGAELRFHDTSFTIKMPTNGKILARIPRYNDKEGPDAVRKHASDPNPQEIVIYQDSITGEIGMIELTEHGSFHPYLGFPYHSTPELSQVYVGNHIAEGTILKKPPGIKDSLVNMYGRTVNVCYLSHKATAEDGVMVNRDMMKHFSFKTYETRVVEFGADKFPLNLLGDDKNYKSHPEIGEMLRPDGLLMVLRTHNSKLAIVEQSVTATQEVDYLFDQRVYASPGEGRIIDIQVHHDGNSNRSSVAPEMEEQTLKYDKARREFYSALYRLNMQLQRDYGSNLNLSKELHRLMVEAHSVVAPNANNVQKVMKRVPLDDWRIKFVIEYTNIPNIGNKFTDLYGGKAVVVHIVDPEEMPVDQHGNRADIVFDPGSTINRMIISRLYEQYFNAASRDVLKHVVESLGLKLKERRSTLELQLSQLEQQEPERFNKAWEYLLGFYELVTPDVAAIYRQRAYGSSPVQHLSHIIHDGYIVLHIRGDHQLEPKNMVADVEEHYPPLYGPVTFRGKNGQYVTTEDNVRIGPMYLMMLEKIADSWSAVSTAKLQHYGVLATMSNADKHSQPIRHNPTRADGESEIRIKAAYGGSHYTAEIMDRNTSVDTHKAINKSIFMSRTPSNIDLVVDRTKVPIGGSRSLALTKHVFSCGGVEFAYAPYKPLKYPNQPQQ